MVSCSLCRNTLSVFDTLFIHVCMCGRHDHVECSVVIQDKSVVLASLGLPTAVVVVRMYECFSLFNMDIM